MQYYISQRVKGFHPDTKPSTGFWEWSESEKIVPGTRIHRETNFLPHLLSGLGKMEVWREGKGQHELKGKSNSSAMVGS